VTALSASSPGARGSVCSAATAITPVYFPKCARTGGQHARSKSMGAEITVDYSHDKDVSSTKNGGGGATSVSPESPLRSRRALPTIGSLSVGAANDDMLHGRAGIVYINGTKMPQDGWYQRCFGCGMWTAQSAVLGQYEVFRCRCCARQFRNRLSFLNSTRGVESATTCSSEPASASTSCSSLLASTSDTATTAPAHSHRGGAFSKRGGLRGVTSSARVSGGGGGRNGGISLVGGRQLRNPQPIRSEGRGRGLGGGGGGGISLHVRPGDGPPLAGKCQLLTTHHVNSSACQAARRAVRRSVRATRQHRSEDRGSPTAMTESPSTCSGGGDADMLDAAEVVDSDAQHSQGELLRASSHQQQQQCAVAVAPHPDAHTLTSLVSKLRNFLLVSMPQNGVENSLRRVDTSSPSEMAYT